MNIQENTNGTITSEKVSESKLTCNNNNNKTDIQADNYNRSKVFDMKSHNINVDLSRVDSQNYPDATDNLDYIANKMGLNQTNNNKPDFISIKPMAEEQSPVHVSKPCDSSATATTTNTTTLQPKVGIESNKVTEQHKKVNIMTKILRRLSKPSIFSKEKKPKKSPKSNNKINADNSTRPSLSSDVKSNIIVENVNHVPSRSKSFRKMFGRFGKAKAKNTLMPDVASSIDSRPSVSSVTNTTTNVNCVGSCNDVYSDKICRDELEKYNSPSVDCILDHRLGARLLKQQESESSNSEDLRDHERKMNASNTQIVSIFCDDLNTPQDKQIISNNDDDKLSPLKLNLTPSNNTDVDRTCHSAMSAHSTDTSSNVKLTLSLHGYSNYGLSSSRFNSKSCMEFGSACISTKIKRSMDNIAKCAEEMPSNQLNSVTSCIDNVAAAATCVVEEPKIIESVTIVDNVVKLCDDAIVNDPLLDANNRTDVVVTSQTSIARSSLIMVAVSHNSPRTKGIGGYAGTPIYNPESPNYPGRKLDFEEEVKSIEEEKTEKNGHYFLIVADQYESDINGKIGIVERYLELSSAEMDDDVIGELNSTVGQAKLLLKEKFVQFRELCDQNINGTAEGGFKTLSCDLEGYATTLEMQMKNLDIKFQLVERIRNNQWRMLPDMPNKPATPQQRTKVKQTPVLSAKDQQRSKESRLRFAKFKKSANNGQPQNFFVELNDE